MLSSREKNKAEKGCVCLCVCVAMLDKVPRADLIENASLGQRPDHGVAKSWT